MQKQPTINIIAYYVFHENIHMFLDAKTFESSLQSPHAIILSVFMQHRCGKD